MQREPQNLQESSKPSPKLEPVGFYACQDLCDMALPGYPGSVQGWHKLVEREQWPWREVRSRGGKKGLKRVYQPPQEVQALIDQAAARPRVAEPAATYDMAAPAENQHQTGAEAISVADAPLVSRCIEAAEKVLGDGYTRQQRVSLAIDTWGMLRRMFPEKLHRLDVVTDDDLVVLARLICNVRRSMDVVRPANIPPLL